MQQPESEITTVTTWKYLWPLMAFTILAFLIAWGGEFVLRLIAAQSQLDVNLLRDSAKTLRFDELKSLTVSPWGVYLLTRCQDFAFSIAGVIMTAVVGGVTALRELGRRLVRWRIGWRWYLAALMPVAWYMAAVVVANGGSGQVLSSFTVTTTSLLAILFGAEYGVLVTFFLRGPMGEELGLRGFALPRLQQRYSAFTASAFIGVVWATWHLPILVDRPPVVLVAFLLMVMSLSFLFTWLFNHSKQSLIPVLIFHTAQNSEEVFESLFPGLKETNWELISSLLLLLCGVTAAIALWRRRGQLEQPVSS